VRANPDVDLRLRVNRGRATRPDTRPRLSRTPPRRRDAAPIRVSIALVSRGEIRNPRRTGRRWFVSFFLADRDESEILDARAEAPRRFALIARVVFARDTESDGRFASHLKRD